VDFAAFLQAIKDAPEYAAQIAHVRELPAREARFRDLDHELHPKVQQVLAELHIDQLWEHQAEAIDLALDGENVVVVSATASGKTLCYTIPIAEQLYSRPVSRALLVYPTKALAQDQLHKLAGFGAGHSFTAETYDGDTPGNQRRRIKKEAHVVLTNPDMLHVGIMPYHHTWADFFRHLKFVVLDEVHIYRGVFGSHTANVIRRLRRIAAQYGADPQFVCCSATIANPLELSEKLTGLRFKLVDRDGSPQGRRLFAMWNPPLLDEKRADRRSTNLEAADMVVKLMRMGVRSICFTLARVQAELILSYVRQNLAGTNLADTIMAYRGGYLPAERREIERKLFDGELLSVTSTTALELGVDIGGLDAAILAGYPGSVASTWQQAGRAGRGRQESLAILMAVSGGINQYIMQNPEFLFDASSEHALIDPHNRFIVGGHLLCAAYELAIRDADRELFGDEMEDILEVLAEHRFVTKRTAWYWIDADTYPAGQVSIRSAGGAAYDIVLRQEGEDDRLLGTIDDATAFNIVHEGAVYLHAGVTYLVEELDIEDRIAYVRPADVDYYTIAMQISEVRLGEIDAEKQLPHGGSIRLGEMAVKSAVIGYWKRKQVTEQDLGREDLQLPPSSYDTVGLSMKLSAEDVRDLQESGHDVMGSIHALEHAMIQLLPLVALCDPHDIGGCANSTHPDLAAPGIFIYDGYPGGVGICEAAFNRVGELLQATVQTIASCPCESGCPSCVQAADCGDNNEPIDKQGALELARRWAAD